ncbi:MAG: DUF3500 domain-containing protein [Agriterribacter sp.]
MAQSAAPEAVALIKLLNNDQKGKLLLAFDTAERYNFQYVPREDRKGISMNELNETQHKAVMLLLRTSLTNATVKKMEDIMQLEHVLKALEKRSADDHYRDAGKYFLTIFGNPSDTAIWGWRFEGHHISFNFSADKNALVAGTPSFLGSNPAIVLDGPQKNKEVLKEETTEGFAMLHILSKTELKKAVIDSVAPGEIITGSNRKAMIEHPSGIKYTEMSNLAQQQLLHLLGVYLHRYKQPFADKMLKDVQDAGVDNLWFTWAGFQQRGVGKPCYYRIQGPSIIIEYDNTQNNGNHIHTVIRDLKNDFGGDELLEHYRSSHHHH